MTSYRTHPLRPQLLVALLVTIGLLFAGMRVPDLSGPHRPKPPHRVVLKSQTKPVFSHLKQLDDFVTVSEQRPVSGPCTWYHAVAQPATSLYAPPLLISNSGRSPPVPLS